MSLNSVEYGPITIDVIAVRPGRLVRGCVVETSNGLTYVVRHDYSDLSRALIRRLPTAPAIEPFPTNETADVIHEKFVTIKALEQRKRDLHQCIQCPLESESVVYRAGRCKAHWEAHRDRSLLRRAVVTAAVCAMLAVPLNAQTQPITDPPQEVPRALECQGSKHPHWQCFLGTECRDQCIENTNEGYAWGTDFKTCADGQFCLYQFVDVVSGRLVVVERTPCLVWCEK